MSSTTTPRSVAIPYSSKTLKLSSFSIPSNESAKAASQRFVTAHPTYLQTSAIDDLRRREFTRLDKSGVYLDYTGAGLYPESLIREHTDLLLGNVFGNPHSASPSSVLSSKYAHAARLAVLNFFDADPSEYEVVFTNNASTALRIVAEAYPYSKGADSKLILPTDAHNSVNGMREFALKAGAQVTYVPMEAPGKQTFLAPEDGAESLYVLTGQSNLSGLKGNLSLLAEAKSRGYNTLLDAAALAPTTAISLRSLKGSVDAMAISLYKLIGYPTGIGCFVAKKEFLTKLQKPWFSGGSVLVVQAPNMGRLLLDGHERWEDGTVNFLSLIAIPRGLQILHNHLPTLTQRLPLLMHFTLSSLASLKHSNGKPVVDLHSPSGPDEYSPSTHGAVISMSFLKPSGERFLPHDIENAASRANIHVRAGCLCNPGASTTLTGMTEMLNNFDMKRVDAEGKQDTPSSVSESYASNEDMEWFIRDGGVVRMGFGLASAISDAAAFVEFSRTFVDVTEATKDGKTVGAPKLKKIADAEIIRDELPELKKRNSVMFTKLRGIRRRVSQIF
ncbi:PLP-dependent transferase [Clavulina sp. PMI_390]|nr:PLP-dependent transferase [Clavulina sp. PMI_390]